MRTIIRTSVLLAAALITIAVAHLHQPAPSITSHRDAAMVQNWYSEQWQVVDSLLERGLPKSALTTVLAISARAKSEGNRPQYIKSVAYRVALQSSATEESEHLLFSELEKETAAAAQPMRAIFQSMLATVYWQYYQQHQWQINERTQTVDAAGADVRTWDAAHFIDTARALHLAAISDAKALQAIPVRDYTDILIASGESEKYRPMLYDLLAQRAFEFFSSDASSLPKPEREFELTDLSAFAPAPEFASHAYAAPDAKDQTYTAVTILQQLTRFHLADADPSARIDLDLARLQFAREKTYHDGKDTAYYQALEAISHAPHPLAAEAGARMAQYHFDAGDYVKAKDMCATWAQRHPGSHGAANCAALVSRITARSIGIELEATTPPDMPVLVSTRFRNMTSIHYRIISTATDDATGDDEEEWYGGYNHRMSSEDFLRALLSKTPVKAWSESLPATSDYKDHTVDVRAPALPYGRYIVLASARPDFSLDNNAIHYGRFVVTRLSLQTQESPEGGLVCRVNDAETGAPLAGVHADVNLRRWNSGTSRYTTEVLSTITTDAQGTFRIAPQTGDLRVSLKRGKDAFTSRALYAGERGKSHSHMSTLFFTDRALYRPGQTVRFKGVVLRDDPDSVRRTAVKGQRTTVTFLDVNSQKIGEQTFTTNDYGSFNGVFTAPAGVLTGMMTIRNEWGYTNVRVEEYKRPTFEVTFDPMKDVTALNASVTVRGNAKSYSGTPLDGARVAYRVTRRARFPYWWWWWRPMPGGDAKEIAHGTALTAPDGTFSVSFTAEPDKSVARKDLPIFTYEVKADVTDINGETRSGTTSTSAGYTSIVLAANAPEQVDRTQRVRIPLSAANVNGQPIAVQGTVRIERLHAPDRIIRTRTLPVPDLWPLSADEYAKAFPHEAWKDERNEDMWGVEQTALNAAVRVDTSGTDSLAIGTLATGRYRLTFSAKDPSGETITVKRFFTVFDPGASAPPLPQAVFYAPLHVSCAPGETASFVWGTGYEDAIVLYQVEHRGRIVREEWLDFDNAQKRFEIPVTESMRGGVTAHLTLVRGYRLLTTDVQIDVPWTNKALQIETATFRDKLLPGSQEEWRITIRGERGAVVAAEMVAAMYDASLDAIWKRDWPRFSWPSFGGRYHVSPMSFFNASTQSWVRGFSDPVSGYVQGYDQLNLFMLGESGYGGRAMYGMVGGAVQEMRLSESRDMAMPAPAMAKAENMAAISAERPLRESKEKDGLPAPAVEAGSGAVKVRSDFSETAFFFPALMTDEKGDVVLSFTMPEALTRWRLLAFAHTPDMQTGTLEKSAVTQKDLMVTTNAPRFLREGDRITIAAKISSMTKTPLSGVATLAMFDAVTMKPLDAAFGLDASARSFSIDPQRSTSVRWDLRVPEGLTAVVYRVIAKAGTVSDGEEAPLPVLPDRMLVTETLPLNIRGNQTRTYRFDKLLASGAASSTLRTRSLTLEMSSNPAWYAVQALPMMMEFPYECSEQVFNRYYANSIATFIAQKDPKIRRVFEQWKGTDALLSNLEKNQELRSVLLQETPWVMAAQDEAERKRRVGLLFDLNTMSDNLGSAMRKLEKAQGANGGWPWFPGMPESRYITQYILAGFGHLRELGVHTFDARTNAMIDRALLWCDNEMRQDYEHLKREHAPLDPKKDWLSQIEVHYLYMRGYFLAEHPVAKEQQEAVTFWRDQAKRHWVKRELMTQGMVALGLFRFGDKDTPAGILKSLTERALHSDEMGTYWKQDGGWWWYQAPIETQSMLIEAFDVIGRDRAAVEEMKIWLLKQKQVQDWRTTIATAEACYALLRRGTDLLAADKLVEVVLGGKAFDPAAEGDPVEAGTGYYKHTWQASAVTPKMGDITVRKSTDGIAWGAMYWQYFEKLENITPAKTPLVIDKKLYRQNTTEKGLVLEPITATNTLHVGDILKVRIEIRSDRDMEYVHLKDMRGAGLEPVNQLSGYKWQGGLGYYEAPKDASVNFFMHWLPKGAHVFEYSLRVTHAGTFSNGISTIQCMYAPEFASHTAGVTVNVAP